MAPARYALPALVPAFLVLACSDPSASSSTPSASVTADAASPADDAASLAGARRNRFYVANTRSESISVIDHDLGEVIATIDVGNQPHGHAPAQNGRFIYATTDGGHGEVLAIDTSSNEIAWRIDVGSDLNEPHLTRDDRFLYAPELLAGRVAVVDVDARQVTGEVEMVDDAGTKLVALHNTYASHDGRWIYVTAILSQTIARIDPATNTIDRLLPLSGDPRPAVISPDDTKMYVQLSELHGFIELDLDTGTETARVEWPVTSTAPGAGTDASPESLPTKCHGIGISPDGKELWAASNLESSVYVYSLPDLEQLDKIGVGSWPNWIAFSSDGETAYVTNSELAPNDGTVSVIDVASREVQATLTVGSTPKRIHRVDLPE